MRIRRSAPRASLSFMRVLQVHTRYRFAGGEDSVVDAERAALQAAGHEVELFEARNPESGRPAALALAQSTWNRSARQALQKACAEKQPDVVHFHNTWFALSPSVASVPRELGIPAVATLHNYRQACLNSYLLRNDSACTDCVGSLPWRGVARGCYRDSKAQSALAALSTSSHRVAKTWNKALDRVLVLTPFAAEIAESSGFSPDKIIVRPNFTDDAGSRPAPPSASDELLFVGRLSSEKGINTLVDSYIASGSAHRLTVLGDGPLLDELRNAHGSSVNFEGRVSAGDITARLLAARALVLPSICFEGLPMTLIEAMSAGTPVLASDQPTFNGFVERQGSGWLVAPGDTAAWSRALHDLDDERVDKAGANGRSVWESDFKTGPVIDQLVGIYASITS